MLWSLMLIVILLKRDARYSRQVDSSMILCALLLLACIELR